MKIVKAEMLWSRTCKLKCSYCGMSNGKKNNVASSFWLKGVENLKRLGCSFMAFYGAEPLMEFTTLPSVIDAAESNGIYTTIITSGAAPNLYKKIDELYKFGAKSLSVSYDIVPLDNSSKKKMLNSLRILNYFQEQGNIRDVAVIATLTSLNYLFYPEMVKKMTNKNIWSFFDIIHGDRGQIGTKCRNYPGIENLFFKAKDIDKFIRVLEKVQQMKNSGFLVHSSNYFLNLLSKNPELIIDCNWNCAKEDNFPAWVTVDVDGIVYPCDDFQPPYPKGKEIYVWELYDKWNEFSNYWKQIVIDTCPGCLWNTHIDAHAIKRGELPFTDYVHAKE
jgi:MoaA/NifB/PqqE/SkfB family radical SAM enzyme